MSEPGFDTLHRAVAERSFLYVTGSDRIGGKR
jgi:hypothetical protein